MQSRLRAVWLMGFAAACAVLAFGIWFQVSTAQHWTPVTLPYGLNNPILAIELAKQPWPVEMLAAGRNMQEMTHQQYIDFGYIPSYGLLFLSIGILQWSSKPRWIAALGAVCIVLILIAVGSDVLEDLAILGVTRRGDATAWAAIRPHAMVKWFCAFLAILLQTPFYLHVKGLSVLSRILCATAFLAGVIGIGSCAAGYEKGIETATLPLLVSMLVMPLFLWLGSRRGLV